MSRVHAKNKFMNVTCWPQDITGPSKVITNFKVDADYHDVSTLKNWLYLKYNMSYKSFRSKSKNRKDCLRKEYEIDTGHFNKKRLSDDYPRYSREFTTIDD